MKGAIARIDTRSAIDATGGVARRVKAGNSSKPHPKGPTMPTKPQASENERHIAALKARMTRLEEIGVEVVDMTVTEAQAEHEALEFAIAALQLIPEPLSDEDVRGAFRHLRDELTEADIDGEPTVRVRCDLLRAALSIPRSAGRVTELIDLLEIAGDYAADFFNGFPDKTSPCALRAEANLERFNKAREWLALRSNREDSRG